VNIRRALVLLQIGIALVAGGRIAVLGTPTSPATIAAVAALLIVGLAGLALLYVLDREREVIAESRQLKNELLANVSHELRTPLNAILGYAEILDGMPDLPADERGQMVGRILSNTVSLTCAVNNLLEYSTVVSGQADLRRGRVSLSELFEEIEPLVANLIDDKPIAFAWAVDPRVPVVETDRGKLRQVLLNLLANAAKFTPAGEIRLSATPTGAAGVEIEVADTGIGMSPTEQLGIFEDFRQVSGSAARPFGGMGLGLALVQRLADLLGGSVAVQSRPAHGTRVALTLPAVPCLGQTVSPMSSAVWTPAGA
jgi:signal transduction histidine kinase